MNPVQAPQPADAWRPAQLSMSLREQAGDRQVPNSGLTQNVRPRAVVTEILTAQQGPGVLDFLMPMFSQLSKNENRWICCIAPPWFPDVRVLRDSGIDLSRVLLVHPKVHQEGMHLVEQVLGSGKCSVVLAWPTFADATWLARLQLAAESGNTPGFLFRLQALDG